MDGIGEAVITQDERTMGTLAHVLQIVGWWIAPLIIFLIKRESKFVSFHALQALLLQVILLCFWIVFMVGWFALIFGTVFRQAVPNGPPPPIFFVLMPLFWLFGMGIWVLVLVAGIVYGIKAGRGEWARYPVLGNLALRMLKLQ